VLSIVPPTPSNTHHHYTQVSISLSLFFSQLQVVQTLQYLGFIRYMNSTHVIVAQPDVVEREFLRLDSKVGPVVDPSRIHWTPYRDPAVKRDKWSLSALLSQQPLPH
jgi:hypothetical protein